MRSIILVLLAFGTLAAAQADKTPPGQVKKDAVAEIVVDALGDVAPVMTKADPGSGNGSKTAEDDHNNDQHLDNGQKKDADTPVTPVPAEMPTFAGYLVFLKPTSDFGTPTVTLTWPNGATTVLTKVGKQDNLHSGVQSIWMSNNQPAHRWGDTVVLEPGIPQSTLANGH